MGRGDRVWLWEGGPVQFGLVLDDLFERGVWGVGGDGAAVDHERGHGRDAEVGGQLDGSLDLRLHLRRGCAGGNLRRVETGLGDGAVQRERGAIRRAQALLALKDSGRILEKVGASSELRHAYAELGCRFRFRM